MTLTVTLVADGSSDRALEPIIRLLLDEHWPSAYRLQTAKVSGLGHRLQDRLPRALVDFPCDLLVVHRDAEGLPLPERAAEVERAIANVPLKPPHVGLIPVRMTEAWLLVDERAIRVAVGNPNGRTALQLPLPNAAESAAAKDVLFRALELASERGARRLRRFDPRQYVHRVADGIEDVVPLRMLPSFQHFERKFIVAVHALL